MGPLSRFFVRLVSFLFYGVAVAAAITFFISDVSTLRGIGWILILFLADKALHAGSADKSLAYLPKSGKVNAADYLSPSSFLVIEKSLYEAVNSGGNPRLRLFTHLAARREIRSVLVRMDVDLKNFDEKTKEAVKKSEKKVSLSKKEIISQLAEIVYRAMSEALAEKSPDIKPRHLFFGVLGGADDPDIQSILDIFNIKKEDVKNASIFTMVQKRFFGLRRLPSTMTGFMAKPFKKRHRFMNRSWTARPTPILDKYAEDITDMARSEKVGFLIGHKIEYDRLVDVLSRPGKQNAILIGDVGSGKEAIIAHLAYQITKDRVPPPLFDKRLVKLDISTLVSGAEANEIQKRVRQIVNEISNAGNVIVYIPNIHNLFRTSGEMFLSAADALLPAVKSEIFSVIGSTTPREYKEFIESKSDFRGAFEPINVQEISESEAVQFLVYSSIIFERQYGITITFRAIKEAVYVARAYLRPSLLPASALDLLREALADAAGRGDKVLNPEDVIAVAEKRINVPIHKATEEEAENLLKLEEIIHRRLVDQDEAVKAVAQALREYRSGLTRKGGPIAVFLFVGPTGVGKTELAKILARIQFGASTSMVRFDMSEYQDKSSVNQLRDMLSSAVAARPYSLVLLDEFEKAHQDIVNLFLQVFDDGRLTDTEGRTVDFQNTIIIATSNAYSNFIQEEISAGKNMQMIKEELIKKLNKVFRPELLNRFSEIIVFKSLSPQEIRSIAKIHLDDLKNQVMEARAVKIEFDDSAVEEIARRGYSPVFGARPLRKVISDNIKSILAEKILRKEIKRGDTVKILYKNNQFNFISLK